MDTITGVSLDRDAGRSRLSKLAAGAETPGTTDPVRLGIRTMSRYSAEKAALAGSLGRAVEGVDNRRHLTPAAYSRAVRAADQQFNEEVQKIVTGNWPENPEDKINDLQAFGKEWLAGFKNLGWAKILPYRERFSDGVSKESGARVEPDGEIVIDLGASNIRTRSLSRPLNPCNSRPRPSLVFTLADTGTTLSISRDKDQRSNGSLPSLPEIHHARAHQQHCVSRGFRDAGQAETNAGELESGVIVATAGGLQIVDT